MRVVRRHRRSGAESLTGYGLPVGTLADARAMVGARTAPRHGVVAISDSMVKTYCSLVHDANPSYWDASVWGQIVMPPGMLLVSVMPLEWAPHAPAPSPLLTAQVPLPGRSIINVSNDTTFHSPVFVGDQLYVVEELIEVSAEKTTRLGVGHFITTLSLFHRTADDLLVAEMTNVLFRFDPVSL